MSLHISIDYGKCSNHFWFTAVSSLLSASIFKYNHLRMFNLIVFCFNSELGHMCATQRWTSNQMCCHCFVTQLWCFLRRPRSGGIFIISEFKTWLLLPLVFCLIRTSNWVSCLCSLMFKSSWLLISLLIEDLVWLQEKIGFAQGVDVNFWRHRLKRFT